MKIVEFKNVTRIYRSGDHELRALDDVDMSLDEGKFVVIENKKAVYSLMRTRNTLHS